MAFTHQRRRRMIQNQADLHTLFATISLYMLICRVSKQSTTDVQTGNTYTALHWSPLPKILPLCQHRLCYSTKSFYVVSCRAMTSPVIHGRYVDTVLLSKISRSVSQSFTELLIYISNWSNFRWIFQRALYCCCKYIPDIREKAT
jgi:hypothetical protein